MILISNYSAEYYQRTNTSVYIRLGPLISALPFVVIINGGITSWSINIMQGSKPPDLQYVYAQNELLTTIHARPLKCMRALSRLLSMQYLRKSSDYIYSHRDLSSCAVRTFCKKLTDFASPYSQLTLKSVIVIKFKNVIQPVQHWYAVTNKSHPNCHYIETS